MNHFKKILIIRFSSLGDLVLTTPVFREIKRIHPDSHITFITSTGFGHIVDNNPYIDQILYHPRKETWQKLNQLIQHLKTQEFDLVYDIHHSLRSRWICFKLKQISPLPPTIWQINKRGWQRTLLIQLKINLIKQHSSLRDILLEPLQKHISTLLNNQTELFPSEDNNLKIIQLLEKLKISSKNLICIGPSASHSMKCWPIDHYKDLISKLLDQGKSIIVVGGPNEKEPSILKQHFGDKIHNLAGELSFLESAGLLNHAKLVICNDTSISHLAEAMGTPSITIFGPTVKEFGYSPFLKQSKLIETSLSCRPCTRNGKGKCKIAQKQLCLTSISPQTVYNQVLKITKN